MGIDISPMPVRHGQTPARRLRVAGKRMLWRAGRGFVVRALAYL
jgi:ribosomal protein L13E